ncbi:hypothetical protein K7432_009836 [Basidiobolus ranarum]|uniref:Uncharacterized protein n=1 Tax=Basidiobolus ranarum TaxID=34480 RepID=A0ABR2VWF4_9FUNG
MSKISASVKNTTGNIQEGLGKVFNSESLMAKGEQKQLQAQEQKIAAEEKNSGNVHSAKGATKENIGEVTHNPGLTADGRVERHQGNSTHTAGQLHSSNNNHHTGTDVNNTSQYADGHQAAANAHVPTYAAGTGMPGVGNPVGGEQHPLTSESHHTAGSSTTSGKKDQLAGGMKEKVGNATNNPSLEVRGEAQRQHGQLQSNTTGAVNQAGVETNSANPHYNPTSTRNI